MDWKVGDKCYISGSNIKHWCRILCGVRYHSKLVFKIVILGKTVCDVKPLGTRGSCVSVHTLSLVPIRKNKLEEFLFSL